MIGIAMFTLGVLTPVTVQEAPIKIDAPQEIMPAIGPYGNCLAERLNAGWKRGQSNGSMDSAALETLKVDVFKRCESAKRDARTNADGILEDDGMRSRQSRQETIDRALDSIERPIRDFGKSG